LTTPLLLASSDGGVVSENSLYATTSSGVVNVAVAINGSAIMENTEYLFVNSTTHENTVQFCVMFEMETDTGVSVNYKQTDMIIIIDMTRGFSITDVATMKTEQSNVDLEAELDFADSSYQCNDATDDDDNTWVEKTQTLSQGDLLKICYAVSSNDISPVKVLTFDLASTGDLSNDMSSLIGLYFTMCKDNKCFIKTMVPSKYFALDRFADIAHEDYPNLVSSGTILMAFGSRSLTAVHTRALEDVIDGKINVQVGLGVADVYLENSGSITSTLTVFMVIIGSAIAFV